MTINTIGWYAAENTENMRSGLNHAGKENFKDNPLYHVPRELTQDALDAKNPENEGPVLLKFEYTLLAKKDFPNADQLTETVEAVRNSWSHDKKTYQYYDKMLSALQSENNIPILAARDFNTVGLAGVSEDNGKWDSLVKTSGFSDKAAGSNGSRGLGKHAPFLASRYSTVLYGTLNLAGETGFQGVAKLSTFEKDGIKYRENVYYGNKANSFTAITDLSSLPDFFKRTETGTDKFIMGFTFDENWHWHFIKTITENFLLAIQENKLIVHVGDRIISKETLPAVIEEICQAEESGHHILKEFYTALTEGAYENKQFKLSSSAEKQSVELYLVKGENFSNTVSMNRSSGMKIFNKDNFKKPPVRFSGFLVIRGPELNVALSETETATHKGWHVDVNEYMDDESAARNKEIAGVISKINSWISKCVHGLAPKVKKDSIDLTGLENILPKKSDNPEPVMEISEDALEERVKSIKIKPVSISLREPLKTGKGKKNKPKKDRNQNPNLKPRQGRKKGDISQVRSICLDAPNGIYKVIITPKIAGNVTLLIQAKGENGKTADISLRDVQIRKDSQMTDLSFTNNIVGPIELVKEDRCELLLRVNESTPYSLEVRPV